MNLDRAGSIRAALGTLGDAGVHVSLVPSRAESRGLVTTPGLLGHKIVLVIARVFAAWSAAQKLPVLAKADAASLDSAMCGAVEIARVLPLHSGDTLALMSARSLQRTEAEIASKLPAIIAVAREFVDRELGGPLVQAHLRDLVITAGAAIRAMGDLEGGVASQGFVTQAYLRDDLGRSSVRRPRGIGVFALRTDCETYSSLNEYEGADVRPPGDIHDISYATAHELVLTAKLVSVHAGATPSASAILDTAATVAPKLATAHLPLASPTFNLVALHGLLRTSGIAALERFAEDAPRVACDIERGTVARLATTYASLRPCFASRRGTPSAPAGGDVQMDVNGVYINLEPAPVKVAIVAAREDCDAYRLLSGRMATFLP